MIWNNLWLVNTLFLHFVSGSNSFISNSFSLQFLFLSTPATFPFRWLSPSSITQDDLLCLLYKYLTVQHTRIMNTIAPIDELTIAITFGWFDLSHSCTGSSFGSRACNWHLFPSYSEVQWQPTVFVIVSITKHFPPFRHLASARYGRGRSSCIKGEGLSQGMYLGAWDYHCVS